ncbi:hypothetical protein ACFL38_00715 [Candidatus Omnitrophota bacterium]
MKQKLSIFFALLLIVSCIFTSSQAQAQQQYIYFNGNDWAFFDQLDITPDAKIKAKALLLRVVYESTVLVGTPAISPKGAIINYLPSLDTFYKVEKNRVLPLLFALKVIDLQLKDASAIQINSYRNALIQRLQKAGVIQTTATPAQDTVEQKPIKSTAQEINIDQKQPDSDKSFLDFFRR